MKNKNELLKSISNLKESLYDFIIELEKYEKENEIFDWLESINEKIK